MNMTAYLFDIDGVLSEPKEKRVTEQGLYQQLIKRLEKGLPIGFNTGRSAVWVQERIGKVLREKISDPALLTHFIIIAEKGATWVEFDETGKAFHGKLDNVSMPDALQKHVKTLVEEKYSDTMFVDSTKETMISIEMHDGYDLQAFHDKQKELVADLKKILDTSTYADQYKIDPTIIGTDIEHIRVGKALGATRFLRFLQERSLRPSQFVAFGDSQSDLAMADELHKNNHAVELIYVGSKEKLDVGERSYPIIFVEGYSQGTLSYLENELKDEASDHN